MVTICLFNVKHPFPKLSKAKLCNSSIVTLDVRLWKVEYQHGLNIHLANGMTMASSSYGQDRFLEERRYLYHESYHGPSLPKDSSFYHTLIAYVAREVAQVMTQTLVLILYEAHGHSLLGQVHLNEYNMWRFQVNPKSLFS